MSSEASFFKAVLSRLVGSGERRRLHSWTFRWQQRLFALMFLCDVYRVVRRVAAAVSRHLLLGLLEPTLHVGALLLVAYLLWSRAKTVVATRAGLELRVGDRLRLIPWRQVFDLREMPRMTLQPPWLPRLYQLDLTSGEALDFVGVRRAREIVIEFAARSELQRFDK